jgi:hypothetical protein
VEFRAGALVVVEPNKRSVYRQVRDGYYEFVNPTNGIAYCMRVIDRCTLEACKPGRDGGTRLTLVASGDSTASVAAGERSRLERIAQSYMQRAQGEPADAQAWSFCSLAAMARAQGESAAQVQQAAAGLKTITSSQANPCPGAIPATIWSSAN